MRRTRMSPAGGLRASGKLLHAPSSFQSRREHVGCSLKLLLALFHPFIFLPACLLMFVCQADAHFLSNQNNTLFLLGVANKCQEMLAASKMLKKEAGKLLSHVCREKKPIGSPTIWEIPFLFLFLLLAIGHHGYINFTCGSSKQEYFCNKSSISFSLYVTFYFLHFSHLFYKERSTNNQGSLSCEQNIPAF